MTLVDRAIGDLSISDKAYLKMLAETHSRILEGGVGASTQILTHYTKGRVVSYDTSREWITRIRDVVFPMVGVDGSCEFREYEAGSRLEGRYDLVFVDLLWKYRLPFARKAWPLMPPGGKLVFHDARRDKDKGIIELFFAEHYREIDSFVLCPDDSNFAVFTKRNKRCDYVDWHKEEGMTPEQLGIEWIQ